MGKKLDNMIETFKVAYNERRDIFVTAWQRAWKLQEVLTFIDSVTFDDSTTIKTSDYIEVTPYEKFAILINLVVTGTPTDILIEVFFSDDRRNFYKLITGPWGDLRYEDSAGNKKEMLCDNCMGNYMQVKVTATGTTASDKFTMTIKSIVRS